MLRMRSASDGSFKREEVLISLAACNVAVQHFGDDAYVFTEPGTNAPFLFHLPEVLTYRMVQELIRRFSPEGVEQIIAQLSRLRRNN